MTKQIEDFLAEFRAAVESSSSARPGRRQIQLAIRNAENLAKHLRGLKQDGAATSRHVASVESIVEHLEGLRLPHKDMRPLSKKAEALLELEDLIDSDVLNEVRELVGTARQSVRRGARAAAAPALPFGVAGECRDCRERIVGLRGGVVRWHRVVRNVKQHESEVHGAAFEQETELRSLYAEFMWGAEDASLGRYRIFRV